MELENKDKYEMFISDTDKVYYFKNGLLHREEGPAIVISKDREQYTNLNDKDLYKLIDKPAYHPFNDPYSEDNFESTLFDILSNESEYYLEGKEYIKQEFDVLVLQKELHTNASIGKKLKI